MAEKMTDQDINEISHRNAYSLLTQTIEHQPQLLSGMGIHGQGGKAAGEMLNALYDQLQILASKSLRGEYGG